MRSAYVPLPIQGTMFGMPHLNRSCGRIDHWVDDGFSVALGETTLRFFSTPGHTPGQGCWHDDHDILVGDTLFAGSIGRTDFPMSDPALAVESLAVAWQNILTSMVNISREPKKRVYAEAAKT